jgi:uncharacterized delta-60 repeat protein
MKSPLFVLLIIITRFVATAQNSWTNFYNATGNGNDEANAIVLDSSNNVFVTGWATELSSGHDYATIKYSSMGLPLWTNVYNGPSNSTDEAKAIAVDNNGDVIVTGYSIGSSGYYDYATIKYSSAGVPLWTSRFSELTNGNNFAQTIAVDGGRNAFVTGYSSSSSGVDYDYATIMYSSAGVPLWTNRYNGPGNGNDYAQAIAVDSGSNAIVTGYSVGSLAAYEYATIKYSSAGVPLWTNIYSGSGNSLATAIALDTNDNVFVTGYSTGVGSGYDYATIKYNGQGLPLWTNRYNGTGNGADDAAAIAVDSSGNVIVAGVSFGVGGTFDYDYATIKYSNVGLPLWTNRYNGPGSNRDFATKVAVDSNGNAFVTGYSTSVNGDYDYLTLGYSSMGMPLWTNRYTGPGNYADVATAIAVDSGGGVLVTGYSTGSGGVYNYATIKYGATSANSPFFIITTDGRFGFTNGAFGFNYSAPTSSNVVIQASTNLQIWWPLKTNPPGIGTSYFSDPQSSTNNIRFYQAKLSP